MDPGAPAASTNTVTTITSAVSSAVYGQAVTYTAAVSALDPAAGTPTGSVQFYADGSTLGSPVTLSGGSAGISTATLPVGVHQVTAVYTSDNPNFLGSVPLAPATETITPAALTVKADDSPRAYGSANPSFTVASSGFVLGEGPAVPGGTVGRPLAGAGALAEDGVRQALLLGTERQPVAARGNGPVPPGAKTSGAFAPFPLGLPTSTAVVRYSDLAGGGGDNGPADDDSDDRWDFFWDLGSTGRPAPAVPVPGAGAPAGAGFAPAADLAAGLAVLAEPSGPACSAECRPTGALTTSRCSGSRAT